MTRILQAEIQLLRWPACVLFGEGIAVKDILVFSSTIRGDCNRKVTALGQRCTGAYISHRATQVLRRFQAPTGPCFSG